MKLDDLSSLIETTTLNKKWIKRQNAKPIKAALICNRGRLMVSSICWKGDDEWEVWDDENILSMTDLIVDLTNKQ